MTKLYTLKNKNNVSVDFLSRGGRLNSIKIPFKDGFKDIILGYDTIENALDGDEYLGAICGRVAGRISDGKAIIDGKEYKLAQNDGKNHLHGGNKGFHKQEWSVKETIIEGYTSAYELSYTSSNGEEGYPGNLSVKTVYAINENNELLISFEATTDKTTIINLTTHPYFNLNGIGGGKIFNHNLFINAEKFTPINEHLIPTGEIRSVKDTAMDFTKPVRLGDRIGSNEKQILLELGIDHNWVLNKENSNELSLACRIEVPENKLAVETYTTQPGVQIYTAMHFDGLQKGKKSLPFTHYGGIAIEPQKFSDAPNNPNFPSITLKKGEIYKETIVYKFIF